MRAHALPLLVLLVLAMPSWALDIYLTEVAPFAYVAETEGGFDGINIRIIAEMKRRSDLPIEAMVVPSARHVMQFRKEDNAYSISQTDNLTDEDGTLIAEVSRYPVVVVTARGVPLNSYDELIMLTKERGLGIMRRLSYAPLGQDERINKVEITTIDNGLLMLEAGRIAALVGSQPAILAAASRNGMLDSLGATLVINHAAHVLRVRPNYANSPASLILAETLRGMTADGTIARIFAEHDQEQRRR